MQGIFLFATASRPALGPIKPPVQWVPSVLSPGIKRLGRETVPSYLSSAKVKNEWSHTSTSPYVFLTCLVKQQIRLHSVVLS